VHSKAELPCPKKMKKSKFGHKQLQKGQILKNEKRTNKFKIFFKITKFKVRILYSIASFAQFSQKQALKNTLIFNIKKTKCPNHLISGKSFQKGQMATRL